jgi:parvulin-like peptidyl-prolyl isomerase
MSFCSHVAISCGQPGPRETGATAIVSTESKPMSVNFAFETSPFSSALQPAGCRSGGDLPVWLIEQLRDLVTMIAMPNQVHCDHILVKTEKEAQAVLDRLSKGEKFSNIAREVSCDPGSGKREDGEGVRAGSVRASERPDLTDREDTIRILHHT